MIAELSPLIVLAHWRRCAAICTGQCGEIDAGFADLVQPFGRWREEDCPFPNLRN